MSPPLVVVAMAGQGRRFADAGYREPKFAVEVRGRTLLTWAVGSLSHCAPGLDFRFAWSSTTQPLEQVASAVEQTANELELDRFSLVDVKRTTRGQAETVALALEAGDSPRSLIVWNVDTYVAPGAIPCGQLVAARNAIYCFHEDRDLPYSWVALDEHGRARRIAEKQKIGDAATIGLYQWASCGEYLSCFRQEDAASGRSDELYVAPLYNRLVAQGAEVGVTMLDARDVVVLGTPMEVEAWRGRT